MFSNVGKKCFKRWCVLCAVQFVTARHTIHTTAWNTFYRHCWTFNDIFLLIISKKL